MLRGQSFFLPPYAVHVIEMYSSQVPAAVENWRSDLRSKNRPKLAERITSPVDQPELFEEGWMKALESEREDAADEMLVEV
jgi:hypothetical protein